MVLCALPGTAAQQQADHSAPERSRPADPIAVSSGYLFVDGEYIGLESAVGAEDDAITINGHRIDVRVSPAPQRRRSRYRDDEFQDEFEFDDAYDTFDEPVRNPSADTQPGPSDFRRTARRIGHPLDEDGIVLLFSGERPVYLDYMLADTLLQLVVRTSDMTEKQRLADSGIFTEASSVAREWALKYVPTADFRRRAEERLSYVDARERENMDRINATRRLASWNYPLSILGMLAVVLGLGHLLSTKPIQTEADSAAASAEPFLNSAIGKSIALIAGMSGLDLIWTLLAHQANAMTEVNPIGHKLIDNPELLILFKITLTAAALSILYTSRRHRTAQLACWWTCLILVLVTARWLTVSALVA
ncbi:MAG: hypothetical protein KDA89_01990 [Planctomycetaceae bacterium]|nr:hypothetical protein [Planctomycetaceae bacterium]